MENEKNQRLTQCKSCQKEVSKTADVCPHCGEKTPGISLKMSKGCIISIVLIGSLFGLFIMLSGVPAPYNKAIDNLTLAYLTEVYPNKEFPSIECQYKEYQKRHFAKCTNSGLWEMKKNNEKIYFNPLNGKALQVCEKITIIPIIREDPNIDISEIFNQFE